MGRGPSEAHLRVATGGGYIAWSARRGGDGRREHPLLIGVKIDVHTSFAGRPWHVWADPTQLENAILNLAVNARDAMDGAGEMKLEVDNVTLAEAESETETDPDSEADPDSEVASPLNRR